MATKKSTAPRRTDAIAWQKGVALACEMFEQIEATSLNLTALESDYRDGAPQQIVALSYLHRLHEANDPAVVNAFAAVLTDYVATAVHCGTPDIPVMRKIARRAIAEVAPG